MENIKTKIANRRTLISTFFFSVVAGGAFSKSVELFYDVVFPVSWSWNYILVVWVPFFIFMSILLRFYIGNLLHIKVLEENPPQRSAFAWGYDFLFILLQFSFIYFMGMYFKNCNIYRFLKLLTVLLGVDCCWILSIWFLGYCYAPFKRYSIPWEWFWINSLGFIILLLILTFYKKNLYENLFYPISMMEIIFAVFLISAVVDIIIIDRHFIFHKKS